jgi:hypothetical protein
MVIIFLKKQNKKFELQIQEKKASNETRAKQRQLKLEENYQKKQN